VIVQMNVSKHVVSRNGPNEWTKHDIIKEPLQFTLCDLMTIWFLFKIRYVPTLPLIIVYLSVTQTVLELKPKYDNRSESRRRPNLFQQLTPVDWFHKKVLKKEWICEFSNFSVNLNRRYSGLANFTFDQGWTRLQFV